MEIIENRKSLLEILGFKCKIYGFKVQNKKLRMVRIQKYRYISAIFQNSECASHYTKFTSCK
jgi:hypothetical protein